MRGRWFLTACIFVLLAAAAALISSKLPGRPADAPVSQAVTAAPAPSTAMEEADPLEDFRTEREQLRSMQTAQLNDIIHDGETDSQTRALAQRTLIDLMAWSEQETTIEGVLRARRLRRLRGHHPRGHGQRPRARRGPHAAGNGGHLELVLAGNGRGQRQCQDHSNKLKQTICQRRDFCYNGTR